MLDRFDETTRTAGGIIVQLANNTATAVKAAQATLDASMPGPSIQRVLIDLRWVGC